MRKAEPCPNGPKHTWAFVKNAGKSTITNSPTGRHGSFAVVGVYSCACGAVRTGRVNVKAPGADLRDHFK